MRYLILCTLLMIHSLSANPMKESYKEGKMVGQGALEDVKLVSPDPELKAEWKKGGDFKAPQGDKALQAYNRSSPKSEILDLVRKTSENSEKDVPTFTVTQDPMGAVTAGGKPPFCIDGMCADQAGDVNDSFERTLTEMTFIYEMSKNPKNINFFTGEKRSCKQEKHKKCCGVSKGIAIDLGLSSCSSGEKALSKLRSAGHCHYLGKKSIKKLHVKIGHKESYCCFGSKFLRIFNEQARLQLDRGWGRKGNCKGLTLSEMQQLDFAEMDLSEAFVEMKKNPPEARKITQKVKDRFKTLTPQKINTFNQRTQGAR